MCVAGIPHYPSWRLSRSYLTGDFLLKTERHAKPPPQVEELYGMLTHVALKLQPKARRLLSLSQPPPSPSPPPV